MWGSLRLAPIIHRPEEALELSCSFTEGGTESGTLYQVLADKLGYTFNYACLEPVLNCHYCAVSSSGVVATCTLERIDLGLAVTEVNYRNKKVKNIKN